MPRVDIPAKVTGGAAYVQDMRLPGMLHARVVRPPQPGAELVALDTGGVEKMPGVRKVVRDGSFLAVVAEREFQAIKAMRALAAAAHWQTADATLPRAGRHVQPPHGLAGAGHRRAGPAQPSRRRGEDADGALYAAVSDARRRSARPAPSRSCRTAR